MAILAASRCGICKDTRTNGWKCYSPCPCRSNDPQATSVRSPQISSSSSKVSDPTAIKTNCVNDIARGIDAMASSDICSSSDAAAWVSFDELCKKARTSLAMHHSIHAATSAKARVWSIHDRCCWEGVDVSNDYTNGGTVVYPHSFFQARKVVSKLLECECEEQRV